MEIIESHEKIFDKLNYFYETNKIPHIIFHGSSGSGKRTIVEQFLNIIYQNDYKRIKTNVMIVNCSHGKGIKFIREELKFFAKTNIQSNIGIQFKTIVLLNADHLTIDAQSALRRCIELFSYNTRFFIIVENKTKLLNPILSRFCEIYVPEPMIDDKIVNLHKCKIDNVFKFVDYDREKEEWINEKMMFFLNKDNRKETFQYSYMIYLSTLFYEQGLSCIDVLEWLKQSDSIDDMKQTEIFMAYDKVKSEYRCEKLLLLKLLDWIKVYSLV